jgi:hypothetical protein
MLTLESNQNKGMEQGEREKLKQREAFLEEKRRRRAAENISVEEQHRRAKLLFGTPEMQESLKKLAENKDKAK